MLPSTLPVRLKIEQQDLVAGPRQEPGPVQHDQPGSPAPSASGRSRRVRAAPAGTTPPACSRSRSGCGPPRTPEEAVRPRTARAQPAVSLPGASRRRGSGAPRPRGWRVGGRFRSWQLITTIEAFPETTASRSDSPVRPFRRPPPCDGPGPPVRERRAMPLEARVEMVGEAREGPRRDVHPGARPAHLLERRARPASGKPPAADPVKVIEERVSTRGPGRSTPRRR